MSTPIGTISGLASNVQWQDIVDQIMQVESSRALGVVNASQTGATAASQAWSTFRSVVGSLRSAASALGADAAFDTFTASVAPTSAGTVVATATADSDAAPTSFLLDVRALAKAERRASATFGSASSALGLSGTVYVNGVGVTIAATDSLANIRDRFATANAGSTRTGVTASVVGTGTGYRLVLASDSTGAAGIDLVDDPTGALTTLGFVDGTTEAHVNDAGATQSARFRSSSGAIATLLGATAPTAATFRAGGQTLSIDLASDSLDAIADRINTALGANTARVTTETVDGTTRYRLTTDAAVVADGTVSASDSARALALLGFTRGGTAAAAQVLTSNNAFTDSGTSGSATAGTTLTALAAGGGALGIASGDTLSISGTRGDGTAVSTTLAITGSTTLQDVLDALNGGAAFGGGTRPATASLNSGRIVVTDGTAGDSSLSVALAVHPAAGGTIALGAFGTGNGGAVGRSRVLVSGADAVALIDGQRVVRSTNLVDDAVGGVTLALRTAAPGEAVRVTVDRDADAIVAKVNTFVSAYNGVRSFITKATASGAALSHDATLRSIGTTLTGAVLQPVTGMTGDVTSAAIAGLHHDRSGVLSLDATTFKAQLVSDVDTTRRLFSTVGSTSASRLSYVAAGPNTKASATPYAVAITRAATTADTSGSAWATYATAGAPDTMTVTDRATGTSVAVTLANGDAIAEVAARLNARFASNGLSLAAAVTNDSRLRLTSGTYGSDGGFTVAYTPGAGGDGTAMLGIAAQTYAGLDVAGTINGTAGTGRGQFLTGATGDDSEGLVVKDSGTTAAAAGTVTLSLGVGGTTSRLIDALSAANTGAIDAQVTAITARSAALTAQATRIQARLDARRAALTRQFVAMEAAISKAQAIGTALSGQIKALQSSSG